MLRHRRKRHLSAPGRWRRVAVPPLHRPNDFSGAHPNTPAAAEHELRRQRREDEDHPQDAAHHDGERQDAPAGAEGRSQSTRASHGATCQLTGCRRRNARYRTALMTTCCGDGFNFDSCCRCLLILDHLQLISLIGFHSSSVGAKNTFHARTQLVSALCLIRRVYGSMVSAANR
jgi:hypothetical protein